VRVAAATSSIAGMADALGAALADGGAEAPVADADADAVGSALPCAAGEQATSASTMTRAVGRDAGRGNARGRVTSIVISCWLRSADSAPSRRPAHL
jgi:hypothetical protein